MISVNDFKTGMSIVVDGELWQVVEFQHVKPGKGAAFVRSKLRNLRKSFTVEKTFRGGEKVQDAFIEKRKYQFLYNQGDDFHFMNNDTYEQVMVPREQMGNAPLYLKDSMMVDITFYESEILGIEVPNFVELEVTETEPGYKGDTAQGASKAAKLETGATVNVPLFVNIGDVLQIDTRSGEYLKRV